MATYLLIESRDPFACNDVGRVYDLAEGLAKAGNAVTLFLVQNGVLPARAGAEAPRLHALAEGGVAVLAETFSLRERAIAADGLAPGVRPAALETVIDHMAAGAKTIWH